LEELGRIGVGEIVGSTEREVGVVQGAGNRAALFVGWVAGGVSDGDVVDDISVVRVAGLDRTEAAFGGVQVVVEAGVVDDPEVGDDVGDDASAAVTVDDVVDDEGGRSIGGGGVIGTGAEVEDDAIAVGLVGALVDFAGDDVVGDDVVEAGVVIEPLSGVEGDGAGPAIPAGVGGRGGDVAVVVDEVVIGGEVIAVDGGDAGTAGVGDGVGEKAEVMGAAAEEAVGGVAIAVQVEALEFEIGRARREGTAAEVEHSGSVSGAGPDEIDRGRVVVFVDDPGRGGAADRRREGRAEVIGTAEETDDRARLSGVSGALEGFRGRGAAAGVGARTGGGSKEGAVGGSGGVVDGNVDKGTGGRVPGGVVDFGGKGMGAVGERVGVEGGGPGSCAGDAREGPAIDGKLDGGDR